MGIKIREDGSWLVPDDTKLERNTTVPAGSELGKRVTLGNGSVLGEGSTAGDGLIAANRCTIKAGCTIGKGYVLGAVTRVEAGVTLDGKKSTGPVVYYAGRRGR